MYQRSRINLSALCGLALMALLPHSAGASQTVRYSAASFEAPTFTPGQFAGSTFLNGQDGWLVTGSVDTSPDFSLITVQGQLAHSGSQAVRVDATGQPTPYAHLRRNVQFTIDPAEPVLDIRFNMYIASEVTQRSEWSLQSQAGPGPGSGVLEWWIDTTNVLHMTGAGGALNTGFLFTRDQWHDVTTRLDYNAQTFEVLIDGQSVGTVNGLSGMAFWYHAFTSLVFSDPGDDQMYFDNFTLVTHDGSGADLTNFCSGDGLGTVCPCGNNGASGEGCANSTGSGAQLLGGGSTGITLDDLSFTANGLPSGTPALLFFGNNQLNGGLGVPFGDGLLCVGTNLVRLGVRNADATGSAQWGPGIASASGLNSGDTRNFQVWYRDQAGFPCGSNFNTSSGVKAIFTP